MAIQFLQNISLNKGEIQNVALQNLNANPSSPVVGQIFYDTRDLSPHVWNGSSWDNLNGDLTAITIQGDSGADWVDTGGNVTINFTGGEGIDTTINSGTLTIAGEDATTSNKGIASFDSGDFSVSSGAVSIKADGVSYSQIQNVTATNRILGRDSAGAGIIEEITPASLLTMLGVEASANNYVLPEATATVRGGIELFSNTDQSVAANSVTTTAGRTYGIQLNSSGQAVVNVPWVDTNTNTTYTAGNGLDLTGTVFSADLKSNGGLVIESAKIAVDLGASSITGTLAIGDGGTGQTTAAAAANALLNISQGGALTIGDSSDDITIAGNLIVTGDTTYHNETIQIIENNTIAFEGTTVDANEILLTAADATGSDKTITLPNLTGHVALFAVAATATITSTAAELNKLDGYNGSVTELNYLKDLYDTGVTSTEFDYLDGVSSNIQTQLNAKQATITGGATTITSSNLTASRALVSNGSGKVAVSAVTSTEVGYLDGVTSNIQTQLDAKNSIGKAMDIPQTGSNTSIALTHSLGTLDVNVQVYERSTGQNVFVDFVRTSTTVVTVNFRTAPGNNEYRAVIVPV